MKDILLKETCPHCRRNLTLMSSIRVADGSEWAVKRCLECGRYPVTEVFELKPSPQKPEIVCLCGSTRFYKNFDEENFRLTLEGKIVLSIGCNTKSDEGLHLTARDKDMLDDLHKRKIDICDSILVLNVGGYIGDSTRSEIEYAKSIGKPIYYLEK